VTDTPSAAEAAAAPEFTRQNRIEVAEQLRRPHPLVQSVSAILAEAKTDDRGIRRSRVGTSNNPTVLEVRLSPASQNRGLRLLDALIKAMETRGCEVSAKGVLIEGEWVPIALMEKDDRTPHVATPAELARTRQYSWTTIPTWDHAPNGLLSIYSDAHFWNRPDVRKRWSDGRTARLEDMLDAVLDGLLLIGSALRQCSDERRRQEEAWTEQERIRQERSRQARMEKARRENLFATADASDSAGRIRKLISEIERRATSGDGPVAIEINAWIVWPNGWQTRPIHLRPGWRGYCKRTSRLL
jgi:hypothetical protein